MQKASEILVGFAFGLAMFFVGWRAHDVSLHPYTWEFWLWLGVAGMLAILGLILTLQED